MTAAAAPQRVPSSVAAMGVAELIDHILSQYHEVHRAELPELIELARKVERVHHDVAEAPHGLADALSLLQIDLDAHMKKEEHVLFPAMREKVSRGVTEAAAQMRHDHDFQDQAIAVIMDLTRGFTLPDGACGSWRRLYAGTAKLCSDLVDHMTIENNVLFPRFELATAQRCTCAHG